MFLRMANFLSTLFHRDMRTAHLRRHWRGRVVGLCVALLTLVIAMVWFTPSLLVPIAMRGMYQVMGVHQAGVQVQGHRWNYLECGDALATPLLMLHGFGTSREAMMGLMPWFAATHHCIAPDLPGFGDHDYHQGETHDADFYLRQLIAFADAVGFQKFDLMGTSMGGALAAHLDAKYPDRVRRLVLLAPAGLNPPVRNAFMQSVDRGDNPLDLATPEDFDRIVALVFENPPNIPWQFRNYFLARAAAHRSETLRIVEAMKPFLMQGLQGELSRVLSPTLVVWGERDRVIDSSMLPLFLQQLPNATGVMIPAAGHVMFSDQPKSTRDVLVQFLNAPI